MSLSHLLHQLLIMPLELIFECIYVFSRRYFTGSGPAIFALSLCMNLLLLPLYRRADAIQDEERALEKRLEAGVAHIKKTFRGDERFMMLQTYYRQNGYRPFYTLKGTLPLVLEVPFFIAAYRFLSRLRELHGASFGPIADLGAPDGLLTVAGLTIHVLPILMTLINFVSSAIYTRGLPRRDKLQLYAMALVFLVLLYRSPSGLVLYWTLNNLFSLVKNLFVRLKNPGRVLRVLLSGLGSASLLLAALAPGATIKQRLTLAAAALLLQLPLLLPRLRTRLPAAAPAPAGEGSAALFYGAGTLLTLLTGVLIPSAVIRSSPAEFVLPTQFHSPLLHVLDSFLLAAGFFLVWFSLFYYLGSGRWRARFSLLLWIACVAGLVDYMFFGTGLGTLTADLRFSRQLLYPNAVRFGNLALLLALAALLTLLWRKRRGLTQGACAVLLLAVLGMSALNLVQIRAQVPQLRRMVENVPEEQVSIPLSRKGKNVVVLMLDRAIGSYIPYLFQERPELERQFAGFTHYPNTLSFGAHTNVGSPALFGGYEYTPEQMNLRADEPLVDKHNEALRVMPVMFSRENWLVTVCDPSYAGYGWIPDLSIYRDWPDIRTFLTEEGQFSLLPDGVLNDQLQRVWSRNFFCYSIVKIAPPLFQPRLYQGGAYWDSAVRSQRTAGLSAAEGYSMEFDKTYAVLCALPELTRVRDDGPNSFFVISNSTTHSPALLQTPDYEPAERVDNRDYDRAHSGRFTADGRSMRMETTVQMQHYHVNMAALRRLGAWFDYLREQGVYDNTRIIIVADHGYNLRHFDSMLLEDGAGEDTMYYNPLLMFKDFDSRSFRTDTSLMTNADTPALAVGGLLADTRNPFTGVPISSEAKAAPELHVFGSHKWSTVENNGSTYLPDVWYAVHGDVRDRDNWRILGVS